MGSHVNTIAVRSAGLALEFAEVGGCGSWETVLMFATELSTDDENLHYVAGLRDPQLVQLYDASVASFAEIAKILCLISNNRIINNKVFIEITKKYYLLYLFFLGASFYKVIFF